MAYRAITGTLLASPGSPSLREVLFKRRTTGWTAEDVYPPDEVLIKADALGRAVPGRGYVGDSPVVDGAARVQLWASEDSDVPSLYDIIVAGVVLATVDVPTGATPLTLQELLELGSPEGSARYETLLTYLSGLWRGAWSATPTPAYARGSLVQNDGSVWIALVDGATEEPTAISTEWDLYAAKGDPGSGGGGGADLSDDIPLALGTASAGVALTASRADHVHPMPSAAAVGAVAEGDARLTDARTPTAHAASHGSAGSDPVTPAAIGAVAEGDARLTDARTPTTHGNEAHSATYVDAAGAAAAAPVQSVDGLTGAVDLSGDYEATGAVSTHNSAADAHGVRLPPTPVGVTSGHVLTAGADVSAWAAPAGGGGGAEISAVQSRELLHRVAYDDFDVSVNTLLSARTLPSGQTMTVRPETGRAHQSWTGDGSILAASNTLEAASSAVINGLNIRTGEMRGLFFLSSSIAIPTGFVVAYDAASISTAEENTLDVGVRGDGSVFVRQRIAGVIADTATILAATITRVQLGAVIDFRVWWSRNTGGTEGYIIASVNGIKSSTLAVPAALVPFLGNTVGIGNRPGGMIMSYEVYDFNNRVALP